MHQDFPAGSYLRSTTLSPVARPGGGRGRMHGCGSSKRYYSAPLQGKEARCEPQVGFGEPKGNDKFTLTSSNKQVVFAMDHYDILDDPSLDYLLLYSVYF